MADQDNSLDGDQGSRQERVFLLWACMIALVATSFAFIIRVMLMGDWQVHFGLSETQKGEIFGAGLWPFGVSIVLFSLIIDRLGYGKAMAFAFICHFVSAILLVAAKGYWYLYWGSILNGLAAGTVEAVINPAIASVYTRNKTKMLTFLHAGWPAGMVLGGLALLVLGKADWHVKVAILLVPVIAYGLMALKAKFPVSERVVAGVSYKEMLAEPGAIGCLIVLYMICSELSRVAGLKNLVDTAFLDLPALPMTLVMVALTVVYFIYTRALGRPLYIFLLLIMLMLATTELGTDSWIAELMTPPMVALKLPPVLVLIYTATIMMILRLCAGPLVEKLNPLQVLLLSAALATIGLYTLSSAEGVMILIFATIYGVGKTFFWPVTLGLVAERFPKGGALTLNAIAGVGMLGVGILGSQLLGFWQDTAIDRNLKAKDQAVYEKVMKEEDNQSIFGAYKALDHGKVNALNDKLAIYDYSKGKDATELAKDKQFQVLVRNAFDHLPEEARAGTKRTHSAMLSVLEQQGRLIDEAEQGPLAAEKAVLDGVGAQSKQGAMRNVASLPLLMGICYLLILVYFKTQGGYEAVELAAGGAEGDAGAEPAGEPEENADEAAGDTAEEEQAEGEGEKG